MTDAMSRAAGNSSLRSSQFGANFMTPAWRQVEKLRKATSRKGSLDVDTGRKMSVRLQTQSGEQTSETQSASCA